MTTSPETTRHQDVGSSPPQSGGEVARAQPETERGTSQIPPRRSPNHVARARRLRHGGNKFSRQVPLGPYYADFVCRQAKLVIELDGSQHVDSGYDKCHDEFMRASGYSVLRFWSGDALKNIGAVCETILAVLDGRLIGDIVSTDLKFVFARTEQSGRECK